MALRIPYRDLFRAVSASLQLASGSVPSPGLWCCAQVVQRAVSPGSGVAWVLRAAICLTFFSGPAAAWLLPSLHPYCHHWEPPCHPLVQHPCLPLLDSSLISPSLPSQPCSPRWPGSASHSLSLLLSLPLHLPTHPPLSCLHLPAAATCPSPPPHYAHDFGLPGLE